jgi:hypothetical protein
MLVAKVTQNFISIFALKLTKMVPQTFFNVFTRKLLPKNFSIVLHQKCLPKIFFNFFFHYKWTPKIFFQKVFEFLLLFFIFFITKMLLIFSEFFFIHFCFRKNCFTALNINTNTIWQAKKKTLGPIVLMLCFFNCSTVIFCG